MTDVGFPGQHGEHTTTTAQSTKTTAEIIVRFDPVYIKTASGILKIIEIVLNLLGFICIESSDFSNHSRGSWFNFVAMTGFCFTGVLLFLYFFHIPETFHQIPWLKIEFIFCVVWSGFFLIASSLAVKYNNDAYIAAGIFGFLAMVSYGIDAFLKIRAIQCGPV